MSQPDRYIPGVPCWVESIQPDPAAAADFYGALFGWECEDSMPPDAPGHYFMGRIGGENVAAISSIPQGRGSEATWDTYVWVDDADDAASRAVEAGGRVLGEPFDVPGAGRMAVLVDPEGVRICVWQAGEHCGATVVNDHGAVNFNDLVTRDVETAASFYGDVFGWEVLEIGDGLMWALPGYGDHLESLNPGTLAGMAEMGAPDGFENVVASLEAIPDDEPDRSAGWGVTFGAEDADVIATRAAELGGTVLQPPTDLPWVRTCVIGDPQGATFTASQFVPETT